MDVLWKTLQPLHMPAPTKNDFLEIANDFYNRWNFPHVIGAIDGKHIRIKCPKDSGSLYYNYKGYFSIVLQAVTDANYKFIAIDVGAYGHESDGGIFRNSDFYKALKDNIMVIPEDDELPESPIILPFFFIGDGAYPLMTHLMKPYPGSLLPRWKEKFNKTNHSVCLYICFFFF